MRYKKFFIVNIILCITLLLTFGKAKAGQDLARVKVDYSKNMAQLDYLPIYPPSEDIFIGDVLYTSDSLSKIKAYFMNPVFRRTYQLISPFSISPNFSYLTNLIQDEVMADEYFVSDKDKVYIVELKKSDTKDSIDKIWIDSDGDNSIKENELLPLTDLSTIGSSNDTTKKEIPVNLIIEDKKYNKAVIKGFINKNSEFKLNSSLAKYFNTRPKWVSQNNITPEDLESLKKALDSNDSSDNKQKIINAKLIEIKNKLNNLDNQTEIDELKNDIASLNGQIIDVDSQISIIRDKIFEKQAEITELEALSLDIAKLEKERNEKQKYVTAHESGEDQAEYQETVQLYRTQITKINDEIDSLKTKQQKIGTLKDDIAKLMAGSTVKGTEALTQQIEKLQKEKDEETEPAKITKIQEEIVKLTTKRTSISDLMKGAGFEETELKGLAYWNAHKIELIEKRTLKENLLADLIKNENLVFYKAKNDELFTITPRTVAFPSFRFTSATDLSIIANVPINETFSGKFNITSMRVDETNVSVPHAINIKMPEALLNKSTTTLKDFFNYKGEAESEYEETLKEVALKEAKDKKENDDKIEKVKVKVVKAELKAAKQNKQEVDSKKLALKKAEDARSALQVENDIKIETAKTALKDAKQTKDWTKIKELITALNKAKTARTALQVENDKKIIEAKTALKKAKQTKDREKIEKAKADVNEAKDKKEIDDKIEKAKVKEAEAKLQATKQNKEKVYSKKLALNGAKNKKEDDDKIEKKNVKDAEAKLQVAKQNKQEVDSKKAALTEAENAKRLLQAKNKKKIKEAKIELAKAKDRGKIEDTSLIKSVNFAWDRAGKAKYPNIINFLFIKEVVYTKQLNFTLHGDFKFNGELDLETAVENLPNGKIKLTNASEKSISLVRTFDEPIAIGIKAKNVELKRTNYFANVFEYLFAPFTPHPYRGSKGYVALNKKSA